MDFCHLEETYVTQKTITGCCFQNITRCFKNCNQKRAHKAAETIGELIEKSTKKTST